MVAKTAMNPTRIFVESDIRLVVTRRRPRFDAKPRRQGHPREQVTQSPLPGPSSERRAVKD
jgi:hypothetical protein